MAGRAESRPGGHGRRGWRPLELRDLGFCVVAGELHFARRRAAVHRPSSATEPSIRPACPPP